MVKNDVLPATALYCIMVSFIPVAYSYSDMAYYHLISADADFTTTDTDTVTRSCLSCYCKIRIPDTHI